MNRCEIKTDLWEYQMFFPEYTFWRFNYGYIYYWGA